MSKSCYLLAWAVTVGLRSRFSFTSNKPDQPGSTRKTKGGVSGTERGWEAEAEAKNKQQLCNRMSKRRPGEIH